MIPRGGLAVQRSKGFSLLTYPHEEENKELKKALAWRQTKATPVTFVTVYLH